jgi:hypothetical protein
MGTFVPLKAARKPTLPAMPILKFIHLPIAVKAVLLIGAL